MEVYLIGDKKREVLPDLWGTFRQYPVINGMTVLFRRFLLHKREIEEMATTFIFHSPTLSAPTPCSAALRSHFADSSLSTSTPQPSA